MLRHRQARAACRCTRRRSSTSTRSPACSRERFPDEPELQICHRLDRETSRLPRRRARSRGRRRRSRRRSRPRTRRPRRSTSRSSTASRRGTPRPRSTSRSASRCPAIRRACRTSACCPARGGLPAITRSASSGAPAATRSSAARSSPAASTRSARTSPHAGFPIVGDKLYTHGDDAFIRVLRRGPRRPSSPRCSCCRATRCTPRASRSRTPRAAPSPPRRRCPRTSPRCSRVRCGDPRRLGRARAAARGREGHGEQVGARHRAAASARESRLTATQVPRPRGVFDLRPRSREDSLGPSERGVSLARS